MSTVEQLLPLPVVIPIGSAVLAPLLAKVHKRLPLILGVAAMLGTLAVLAAAARDVYAGHGHVLVHFFSSEKPVHGKMLGIAFGADPFGLLFALLTAGVGLLLLVSLLSEFGELGERELSGIACLTQLLLAALIGAALTADTINLFVWFEVAALSSYGLTGFFLERPIAVEAAFKIMVLTTIASFAVFAGAGLLYRAYGALNLGQLHNALSGHVSTVAVIALALLVGGFATKAGIAPFHAWLPDAHTPVPGGISALFSALMVDLGIIAIARLSLQVFGPGSGHAVLGLITGLGIASALLGAVMTLAQDDLKRLLAWDTVSQMGVLLVGFGAANPEGVSGAVFHLLNHGLFKALLFLCAGAVVHATGKTHLSELGGLARRLPLVTVGFTVGAMAISGVPGFNAFSSLSLVHEGIKEQPAIHTLALIAQLLTVAAMTRATYLAFFRHREEPYEHVERTKGGMRFSLITLGTACIAIGVMPYVVIRRVIAPAASILLHPQAYAGAVLGGGGAVPDLVLHYSYGKATSLIQTGIEIGVGIVVGVLYLRIREPAPVTLLRRLHTGSVNDYAAFLAAGMVLCAFVLL